MSIKNFSLIALTLSSASVFAANQADCRPAPGAPCNADDCCRMYCVGPDATSALAPVRPRTCNGDVALTVAGFYWNAHQDGMEYAIESEVFTDNTERAYIVNGDYKNPSFKWDFGFKLGLGYNTPCDGWDVGVLWTNYNGKASSHNEAEASDNTTLITLWSDVLQDQEDQYPLYASDINTSWKLKLNLIDIELGRDSWFGKRVAVRPHVGLRVAYLEQDYDIEYSGGVFTNLTAPINPVGAYNDFVKLENEYKGVGVRGGLDTVWNMGCGWGIYGNLAFSVIYGRFEVDHNEFLRDASDPHHKEKVIEARDSFRASRYMTDVALGLRYAARFCECQYALSVSLGWEHHLFLNQNQMWRVVRNLDDAQTQPNATNIYHQRRGDLDTQGWTLTVVFDF